MSNPLFSVCIPTRNRAHLIGRALESCLRQTYRDIEVVVADNAGNDGTEEVVGSYADKDSRVKFFRNDKNLGQTRNIFRVFELAAGDYVQYLADDNWLADNYAEEKVRCFDENPEAGLVSSALRKTKPDGKPFLTAVHPPGRLSADFVFENFYRNPGWFGLICTARRADMREALAALSHIPNPFGYDYLETAMVYDLLPFLRIMSKYPYMIHTDRTVYFDEQAPSEIPDMTLSNLTEWHHRYKVALEHTLALCGRQADIPPCRRFLGASLFVDILRKLIYGNFRTVGFSLLPRYYAEYAVSDRLRFPWDAARLLAQRGWRRMRKSFT